MSEKKETRKLGFWLGTSLVVGNMTGSGIFLLPAALAVYGGISIFGWIFTTIGVLFLALIFARLSKLITKAGGPYIYAKEGFGDFTGFLVVWGYWVSIWCGNAAISVAGVGYLSTFFPALKSNPFLAGGIAIAAIWIFTFINTKSIRSVGQVQFITTVLKILPLLIFGTVGFLYFNSAHFKPFNLSTFSNFEAITASAALTLWAFLGLESVTIPSDKVSNPAKTVSQATIAGTLIAALIYISSTVAIMGILKPSVLQVSTAPFADAARMIWGNWAAYAIALGAIISCFGALNGWILLQGQLPMAAARDKIFPAGFKKVSKNGIPLIGLIISSVLASVLVTMNYSRGLVGMFSFIIMLATLNSLVPYFIASLVEILLYLRKKKAYQKRQLVIAIIIAIPAFLYSLWAITGLGLNGIFWGIVLLIAGVPIFLFNKFRPQKN